MRTNTIALSAILVASAACTTLGPVPTSTGVSPIPHQRPGLDVQAGQVPGAHISSMTQEDPEGSGFAQLAAVFEPDRLLGLPGLIAGGRFIANNPNQAEPYLGWRGYVDDARTIAVAAIGFGTQSRGTDKGADVESTRVGAEVIADANLTGRSKLAELHFVGSVSAIGLWASGHYCVDADGHGVDCPDTNPVLIEGNVSGLMPAARAGVAVDFMRARESLFHGGRLELTIGGGTMPSVVMGEQDGSKGYVSAGLTLTLGVGAIDAGSSALRTP